MPASQGSPPLIQDFPADYRQLVEALPVAVYTCDADGRIIVYNEAAVILWGREPVPGDRWSGSYKIYRPDATPLPAEECPMAITLRTGKAVVGAEIIIERPDGSRRFVMPHPQPLFDAAGKLSGGVNMLLDITDRKIGDEVMMNLAAIVQGSEDAIISKTLNGIVTSWNPSAERLFGYTQEEMIGQPIARLIPTDRLNEETIILDRIRRGERVQHFDTVRVTKQGRLVDISLTISPLRNKFGIVIGASKIARNITLQKSLYKALFDSEQKFRNVVMQAPTGITILQGTDFVVEMANETYLTIIGKTESELVGQPLFSAVPELIGQQVHELLTGVMNTGKPYYGTEFPVSLTRNGRKKMAYFNFVYQALRNLEGAITGVIVVASDVTAMVEAKHGLTESEKQFRNMVMQSPIPVTIFRGPEHIIEIANTEMFRNIWRKEEKDILGRKALEVFPELKDQKYANLLKHVLATGETIRETESVAFVRGDDGMKKFFLDYEYSPLQGVDGSVSGIMITVNDVTEKVEARQKVEDAEERLRLAADGAGLAMWDLDLQTRDIIYSPRLAEIFGHHRTTVLTHADMRSQVHPDDRRNIVEKKFQEAMVSGQYNYEARVIWPDKSIHWIRTLGKVFFDPNHTPLRMLGTMEDITAERWAQKRLEDSEQRLSIAIQAAKLGTWELDLKTNNVRYSPRYLEIFGYTEYIANLDRNTLTQHMHPDDLPARSAALEDALRTGQIDYEFRIIWKDGSLHWCKAQGNVFYDDQRQPAKMLGTLMDITESKNIEQELEKRVLLRTEQLQEANLKLERSNHELEQYAYVASHDLQEPLRKIRTYSGILSQKLSAEATAATDGILQKIIHSAERMSNLIYDLLNFSRLMKPEVTIEYTDLNVVLNNIINDFELAIQQKNATVVVEPLPSIQAVPLQMNQLFYNLVNNALKFARTDVAPTIRVDARELTPDEVAQNKNLNPALTYVDIRVTDNGIGFEQPNAEKIFEVFRRLHNKDRYPGSGIGLALCRKIAVNHGGDIYAEGKENEGSTFHTILPIETEKP